MIVQTPLTPGAPAPAGAPSPGAPAPPTGAPVPFGGGFQSFTGPTSVRYPAPDVARGFMLLLIALANAPFWLVLFRDRAEVTGADTIWTGLRAALVDHRSYPLFAMLFGFGLAIMARRRIEADLRSAGAHVDPADVDPTAARTADPATATANRATGAAGAARTAAANRAAARARRLIRRRGMWMLVFAAVHGALFMGDIIGDLNSRRGRIDAMEDLMGGAKLIKAFVPLALSLIHI